MIAGLPMYDRPELFEANNKFWQVVHKQITGSPKILSRNISPWDLWTSPKLFLAQTCSSPYRDSLHKILSYVGTADYALPNCPPGYYNSLIISRPGYEISEIKTCTFGYNEKISHSGWTAPMAHFRKLNISPKFLKKTGSHRASVKSVASGKIDFAAVDAQSWRFIKKYDKFSINIRVLDHTNPTPSLPFITSQNGLKENLFISIKKAIEALSEKYRSILYLNDFMILEEEKYLKYA